MKRLFLVRHGQTAYNAQRRFQGQIDVALNERGEAQAQAIAAHLAATESIDRIVASDLTRARQTAQAIGRAAGVDVEFDPGLREITVGEWEGLDRDEIHAQWPDLLAEWNAGADMRPPGGESRNEAGRRVADAVERLVDQAGEDEVLVIVAHGAVIRGTAEIFLGLVDSPRATLGVLDNCDYAEFARRGSLWVLRRWGGSAPAGASS
ncbi:histidine phosphatase family protein [Brevibacterium sp. 5221]|uniref:Histidine phosphatase family protein n=1 Tax=Brevibacterium rongguiense TaxID=2695267 RepID=A0A6N9H6B8_9MICO|nr:MULTISPECIES: histidine phosphatase family protein [Brevibacterium]MYM19144.1 histidine phosphatase family protein [Brevibacterium rongguiense]WAL40611.1 histidine phosphatase family protein [Brevibacterium sp. BRM-1]